MNWSSDFGNLFNNNNDDNNNNNNNNNNRVRTRLESP